MGRLPDSSEDRGNITVLTYLNATVDPRTDRVDARVEIIVKLGKVTGVKFVEKEPQ
tara:strand:+ start:284 stop:451 length:168 start_codon:yes stop_codon:yes gene_type:complete